MAKLTLTDITSGYALTTTVNANNALIETALENTLSRDGTAPNTMNAVLDMNSFNINNLPDATANQQPVTLAQAASIVGVTNPLSRENVGAVLYPQTSAETTAGVTPTNYYYPPGEVKRYGATGDGATDDSVAIQAAYDSNNLVMFTEPGTYMVDAQYTGSTAGPAVRSNTEVFIGPNCVLAALDTASANNSSVVYIGPNVDDVLIHGGGEVRGERAIHTGSTGEAGHCFYIEEAEDVRIQNLTITNGWGDGIYIRDGSGGTPSRKLFVDNCRIQNCRRNNISLVGVDVAVISNCHIKQANGTSPENGIDIEPNAGNANVTNVTITNCVFEDNNTEGLRVEGTNQAVQSVSVSNCTFDNNNVGTTSTKSQLGIRGANTSGVTVSNCAFRNANDSAADIHCEDMANFTVTGCTIDTGSADHSGILIDNCDRGAVSNNVIANCGRHGISAVDSSEMNISNNIVRTVSKTTNATYDGISLANVDNSTISGNHAQRAGSGNIQAYGLDLDVNCANVTVTGNKLQNSGTTGNYRDSSVTTHNSGNSGVQPTVAYGATASVADGGTITHTFNSAPDWVVATGSVASEIVTVTAVAATTFTVAIKTDAGAAGTSQTIYWQAGIVR